MSTYGAAIGRQHGKADTDNNGLARYELPIEVPKGIKSGNEPNLSLQYSQGTPNGIMGFSWALGGVSSIHVGAAKLVYDNINPPPKGYDSTTPKLIMDGKDLLNTQGAYLEPQTVYTTEVDNTGLTVTSLGTNKGFLVRDNMGHETEYGTTLDSRIVSAGQADAREWRIKRQKDCHGNTIFYHYTGSPVALGAAKDVNTSYLSSIYYCSNSVTGVSAIRCVIFGYEKRSDVVKQSIQGAVITWAKRLSSISIGVVNGGRPMINRTYSLEYEQSPTTGDSCLAKVIESAIDGANVTKLLPSSFTYTTPGLDPAKIFKTVPASPFSAEHGVISLIPLNITGKALTDMACLVWDEASHLLTIKTYLVERTANDANKSVTWSPSQDNVKVTLPFWSLNTPAQDFEMPFFLTPDLRGDGRSDLIIPFQNANKKLEFFLSESNGVGLTAATQSKTTTFDWTPKSRFMAMDLTGTGSIDVVQIYKDPTTSSISFRNFPGILDSSGNIGLSEAFETPTKFAFDNTIDWFLLRHSGTGAVSLVRVWQSFLANDLNKYEIKTTSFRCAKVGDSSAGFEPAGVESTIGGPYPKDNANQPAPWSVLSCDINGDGTQDIVLGKAEFVNPNMNFTFEVSLGDGRGGFARVEQLERKFSAPAPKGNGIFSVTNINGGLYPSLAYVYKRKDDSSFMCVSVDGRSDGTVGDAVQYHITTDAGSDNARVMSIDLNGTGMGAWLVHSIDTASGQPSIIPVYNLANPTDLLLSGEDPMGLTTTLSYGSLSDGVVYDSGVDWKNYKDTNPGNYVVQGAPNHVVTSLKHTNNAAVNSLAFEVLITKTYRQALINSQGRGWLGFESIKTTNATDHILTVEHYGQTFPMIGIKKQIDTLTIGGVLLSSKSTDYESIDAVKNAWKIYHFNKKSDKIETGGPTGRVQLTEFACDESGNIISKHYQEQQSSAVVFQSWERCTYQTINGITGLLTGKKLSAIETNTDVQAFQPGDATLTRYTYNQKTALLETVEHWSDDVGKFLTTTYTFDEYGNEVSVTDPAGLTTTTTYDTTFHNLAVKQIEVGKGVSNTSYVAYDRASGKEVAKLETNGRLVCTQVDGFGRNVTQRMTSVVSNGGANSISAKAFFSSRAYVSDVTFDSQCGINFSEVYHGHDIVTFQYRTLGSASSHRGLRLCRTDEDAKIETGGRPGYPIGGAEVVETINGPNQNAGATNVELWSEPRTHVSINGKELVLKATNQDGWISKFQYDVSGNMTLATDPAGNTETRKYTSLGQLRMMDNRYANMNDPAAVPTSPSPAMTYEYDDRGQLVRTTNAKGEVISFKRDSKARPTSKTAKSDGRTIEYEYDVGNTENLSSMTIYPQGNANGNGAVESRLSFKYDALARLSSRTLTLANDQDYETTFKYDWQGQTTLKSYPNGALKESRYVGGLLSYSRIYHQPGHSDGGNLLLPETWLDSRFEYSDATGKPTNILVGQDSMKTQFTHTLKYDFQAYPLTHSLDQVLPSTTQSKSLVHEVYTYNGMGQLAVKVDSMANTTTKYTYKGRRLESSQVGSAAAKTYTYDVAGNLTTKADMSISYTSNGAQGVASDGITKMLDVVYDRAGRMTTRSTLDDTVDYTYDSFGVLRSYTNAAQEKTEITAGPDGRIVRREPGSKASSLLLVSDDYNVQHNYTDGSVTVTVKMFGAGMLIGTFSKTYADDGTSPSSHGAGPPTSGNAPRPSIETTSTSSALFVDHKGNVTYRFRSSDGSLLEQIAYDDFGTPTVAKSTASGGSGTKVAEETSSYESKRFDVHAGLLDFGARMYDPLLGRFTTPDDVLDVDLLAKVDGLNRMAFENNDPINHTDPSGQWSLSAIFGAILGAALVAGAIALTVATGGAATPLLAASIGALATGGIAGISYSFDHRNERGGKFWGGYAATVLVNAAIGAASGFVGAVATPARFVSATGRLGQAAGWSLNTATQNLVDKAAMVGGRALIGGVTSLLQTVAHNAIENQFHGANLGLFDGAATAFGTGAAIGGGMGMMRGSKAPEVGRMAGVKNGLGIAVRASWAVAKSEHVPERAQQWAQEHETYQRYDQYRQQMQAQYKAMYSLVPPSGLVGILHSELQRHQSFVNYG